MMRGRDAGGAGYFGAPRSSKPQTGHRGVDFLSNVHETHAMEHGEPVRSLANGMVTKIGWPYRDKPHIKYVEVQDAKSYRARHFYVDPTVEVGDSVEVGDMIGTLQDLGMHNVPPHLHFEVKTGETYHDPLAYLCGDLR
jgi:peptidoglycan LD-endopeptidase LytH